MQVEIKKHHIREFVSSGSIDLATLSSENQVEDILTKVSDANARSYLDTAANLISF